MPERPTLVHPPGPFRGWVWAWDATMGMRAPVLGHVYAGVSVVPRGLSGWRSSTPRHPATRAGHRAVAHLCVGHSAATAVQSAHLAVPQLCTVHCCGSTAGDAPPPQPAAQQLHWLGSSVCDAATHRTDIVLCQQCDGCIAMAIACVCRVPPMLSASHRIHCRILVNR